VVTWVEADGATDARSQRFFEMRAALAASSLHSLERFDVAPELRAALHLGEVIAREIEHVRRAIASSMAMS
jgi:adenylate cyclase